MHQRPRTFGKETSIWTLSLAAEGSFTRGLASRPSSGETIRHALKGLGVRWNRAKHGITRPDPDYVREKKRWDSLLHLVQAHPSWALGFLDAVWWSRFAQRDQHRRVQQDDMTRLHELECATEETDVKALACCGVLLLRRPAHDEQMRLRFVDGCPVSAVPIDFLMACCQALAAQSITALVLIWDHASWHNSQIVRTWLRSHHQMVKQPGSGVRMLSCLLPTNSPWLHPIEAKWYRANVLFPKRITSRVPTHWKLVCAW